MARFPTPPGWGDGEDTILPSDDNPAMTPTHKCNGAALSARLPSRCHTPRYTTSGLYGLLAYRFHTTIVNGEVQLKRLAEELARPDRAYDFNVRHLLIFAKRTSTVHVCDDYGTVPRPANSIDSGKPFSSLELSIQQILRSAAPTVRNLMVFAPMLDFVRLQQGLAFTQLSDLTLHSHSLNHPPVPGSLEAAEDIASTLSTVHRLHLCQTVHASFPSIEYLRLSGFGPSESNLLAALRVHFKILKDAVKTDVGLTATMKQWLIGSTSNGLLNAEVKALCGIMKTLKRFYLQRSRRNDVGPEPHDALRWLMCCDDVEDSDKVLLLPKVVKTRDA
ncbi:hypothetical protein PUNSTDRAFT_133491 [Punctularia strigosozonata HHB-11173 SS5]|uniref:uncharacterized protein n=1 Tax=Punctularia strigosozonata (strain HHB-11173) TaxID=741275 RepID=UPI0004417FEA|nr:uncharacterized protein PUNSTDRAFT_133491 [Punctularia strigosozonata HHB-11173 SS5]EIN09717.1 hypothetical protein PUNSTDRAFT_133491 [Punctularia strigosozonata HHB-11173 SS5]